MLTLAAPPFLHSLLLPAIAQAQGALHLRALELAPMMVAPLANAGLFEMAITAGVERLPSSWDSIELTSLRYGLFASPPLAASLGQPPVSVDRIRQVRFVCPIYVVNGNVLPGEDRCPLPVAERTMGHEVQTFAVALDLATVSHELVFGPTVVAKRHVAEGSLAEVQVDGWSVAEPLYLSCDALRVKAKVQASVADAIRRAVEVQ